MAFLLDAKIRRADRGARSLDDALRLAYRRFAASAASPEELRAVLEEVAGIDLGDLFRAAVETAGELDYREMLKLVPGLGSPLPGQDSAGKAWLGADTKVKDGRLVVTDVPSNAPTYGSGLTAEDELIALDDFRLEDGDLDTALKRYGPGDTVSVLVSRLGELRRWRLEAAAARRATGGRSPSDPTRHPTNGGGWPPGSVGRTEPTVHHGGTWIDPKGTDRHDTSAPCQCLHRAGEAYRCERARTFGPPMAWDR